MEEILNLKQLLKKKNLNTYVCGPKEQLIFEELHFYSGNAYFNLTIYRYNLFFSNT